MSHRHRRRRCRSTDWGWEDLRADYSNVRGFNYVPVYPALYDNPPVLDPPQRFFSSASPVGTWRFWQAHDVDRQLGWLKAAGCNAVRVFLSYAVWRHDEDERAPGAPNLFISRFVELLRLCEKHRLYLMPVLWNAFSPGGSDPSATPYEDISNWPRSPAHADTNVEWALANGGDEYVRAVCAAGRDSRAVFIWDIGNEPSGEWFEWFAFMARLVREVDPNPTHGITVSFAAYPNFLDNPVPAIPEISVLGFHPYGVFRQNTQEWVRMARRSARPSIADRVKPILATEGGSPGLLMLYQDFFRQIRDEGVA
jgi:hypothetical protein